jgi:hypothetical protein
VGEDLRGGALNNMVMGKNNVLLMYARNNDVTLAQYLLDNVTRSFGRGAVCAHLN